MPQRNPRAPRSHEAYLLREHKLRFNRPTREQIQAAVAEFQAKGGVIERVENDDAQGLPDRTVGFSAQWSNPSYYYQVDQEVYL